jgi:hypothetical protein
MGRPAPSMTCTYPYQHRGTLNVISGSFPDTAAIWGGRARTAPHVVVEYAPALGRLPYPRRQGWRGEDAVADGRLTLREAAIRLGVSEAAIRKRVARGTLRSEMGSDGRRYVWLGGADGGADNREETSSTHESGALRSSDVELIEELREEVHYLREQLNRELERRSAESERYQRIVAGLTQANTDLTERLRELEAPQEPSGSPETASGPPDRGDVPPATGGAREEGAERPWWRRVFGG